ncbi:hypothetical protein WJX84_004857 [Apatococcus fuscideae]|uniref:Uncharacterized protein n=1 Tax=Apatococcus fuscideae TaxID=2026836 RepID=A0AAW1TLM3_9CHLO
MMEARNWSIDPTGIVIPLILYSDASLNIGSANAFHPVMVALGSLPRRRLRKSCNHLLRIAHLPVLDKKALSSSDAEFTEMKRAVLHLVLDEDELVKAMGYRYQVAMWSAEWTAGGLREQNWTPERAVHSTGMSLHSGRPKTCCRAEAFCGLGRLSGLSETKGSSPPNRCHNLAAAGSPEEILYLEQKGWSLGSEVL